MGGRHRDQGGTESCRGRIPSSYVSERLGDANRPDRPIHFFPGRICPLLLVRPFVEGENRLSIAERWDGVHRQVGRRYPDCDQDQSMWGSLSDTGPTAQLLVDDDVTQPIGMIETRQTPRSAISVLPAIRCRSLGLVLPGRSSTKDAKRLLRTTLQRKKNFKQVANPALCWKHGICAIQAGEVTEIRKSCHVVPSGPKRPSREPRKSLEVASSSCMQRTDDSEF